MRTSITRKKKNGQRRRECYNEKETIKGGGGEGLKRSKEDPRKKGVRRSCSSP